MDLPMNDDDTTTPQGQGWTLTERTFGISMVQSHNS